MEKNTRKKKELFINFFLLNVGKNKVFSLEVKKLHDHNIAVSWSLHLWIKSSCYEECRWYFSRYVSVN